MSKPHVGYRYWTPGEEAYVRATMSKPLAEVAERLGRSVKSIIAKRRHLIDPDLIKSYGEVNHERNERSRLYAEAHGAVWSSDEIEFVLETLEDPIEEVALVLGRTYFAVAGRRNALRNGAGVPDRQRGAGDWPILGGSGQPKIYAPTCPHCNLQHAGECM